MKRSFKDFIFLGLKGMAMGAADVVPGVSGGTIAFISGIYEELLESINSINFGTIKVVRKEGIAAAWRSINGSFLITLLFGIGISIVSLAKLIGYLIHHDTYSVLIWSFFFGLIISSVFLVGKTVKKWNITSVIGLIAGTVIAYIITILPPTTSPDAMWFIFLSGCIAICAMILPGVSGSFILLLLGSYQTVLNAISEKNFLLIGVFAGGCITGLLAFSRVLNWMFKKFHDLTIALLTGFLIGSLNKIWPWKSTVLTRTNSSGEEVPFIQENVLPTEFDGDAQILYTILLALVGFSILFALYRIEKRKST